MFIKSLDREVEIKTKTRKIMREVNEALLDWVELNNFDGSDIKFPAKNADKSEEVLVKLMTWLNQNEIDNLTEEEYLDIKEEITKKK